MTANLGNGTEKCTLWKGTYYNQATEWHNMAGGCLPPRTTLLIETNTGSMASCSLPGSPSRALHNNQLPPWIHNTASWNSSTSHSCLVQDPDWNSGQNIFLWLLSLWIVGNVWSHFCSIASAQWDSETAGKTKRIEGWTHWSGFQCQQNDLGFR